MRTVRKYIIAMSQQQQQQDFAKQLYDAAVEGNVALILRLLHTCDCGGHDLVALLAAQCGYARDTALHAACCFGHMDVVLVLLLAKANPEAKDEMAKRLCNMQLVRTMRKSQSSVGTWWSQPEWRSALGL